MEGALWFQSLIMSLAAAAIGFLARLGWDKLQVVRRRHGLGALLAGMETPVLIVFPPREPPSPRKAILPQISIESSLAINNIITAFLAAGHEPPSRFRDPRDLTEEEKRDNNLIMVCSGKRNPITKEALELLRAQSHTFADLIPSFEQEPHTGRLQIRWNKGAYSSESFDQPGPEYDDVALIVKVRSPWDDRRKILIVAGVRGVGTWGAAEFLKKWWRPLYEWLGRSRRFGTSKRGDFAALVSVRYCNYDIKEARLLIAVDLDEN